MCFCERVGLCLQVSPKPQKWSLCEVTGLDILGIERPDKEHVPVRFVWCTAHTENFTVNHATEQQSE